MRFILYGERGKYTVTSGGGRVEDSSKSSSVPPAGEQAIQSEPGLLQRDAVHSESSTRAHVRRVRTGDRPCAQLCKLAPDTLIDVPRRARRQTP